MTGRNILGGLNAHTAIGNAVDVTAPISEKIRTLLLQLLAARLVRVQKAELSRIQGRDIFICCLYSSFGRKGIGQFVIATLAELSKLEKL